MKLLTLLAVSAGLLLASSAAVVAKPATVTSASATGNLTSGGSINYQLDLATVKPGDVVVKVRVISSTWNERFATLKQSLPVGETTLIGSSLPIPPDFTGRAKLRVRVIYRNNVIARHIILPFDVVQPIATTALYDVGFENPVTLDGSFVSTAGMGSPLTYNWTQTSGKSVMLSSSSVKSPTFTTDALTNFVRMGEAEFIEYIDDITGETNEVYVTRENRFATNNVGSVALDAEQADATHYIFRLLVSDGSMIRTGNFTVACSMQTPAQPSIPVGVKAYFRGGMESTSWALLSRPATSTASLKHTDGLISELLPDVEGIYVIKDNVTGNTVTNQAATWTGVQFCAICHGPYNNVNLKDMVTPWSQTGHATFFTEAIDGDKSAHYGESCIACHTVGFNKATAANNSGFDDVAKATGWKFPSVLQHGNWDAMPADLQAKSNIQCESCHGPGSRHPGSPSITTDVRVCAQCHQDGNHHVRPQQWEISPHSGGYEEISASRGTRNTCSRCHSAFGFIDQAKRLDAGESYASINSNTVLGAGALTCQACHDPHAVAGGEHQLRVFDKATVGDWSLTNNIVVDAYSAQNMLFNNPQVQYASVTLTNLGTSATCVECHNGRRLADNQNGTSGLYGETSTPHDSLATEALYGIGAVDYGVKMGNSFHTYLADCTTCHMHQGNTAGNTVGDHTFSMKHENGGTEYQNVAACNQCHTKAVEDFDYVSLNGRDYDGNGAIEGVQTETVGLLDSLGYLMQATGVSITTNAEGHVTNISSSSGYAPTGSALRTAQRRALWNWLLEYREGSFGVHNTQFTIRMLQTTYTDLNVTWTGSATNTFQNAFPNAFLR